MSSRAPPPPPIYPRGTHPPPPLPPMAETHPPQLAPYALPPPSYIGQPYGAGAARPPPPVLSPLSISSITSGRSSSQNLSPYPPSPQPPAAPASERTWQAAAPIDMLLSDRSPPRSDPSYQPPYATGYPPRQDPGNNKRARVDEGRRSPWEAARQSLSALPSPSRATPALQSPYREAPSLLPPPPPPPLVVAAAAVVAAPPTSTSSATNSPFELQSAKSTDTYDIQVRQQPLAARACGFGERDRRVIDPPPIVQLIIKNANSGASNSAELRYPFNVVHCTLWSADGLTDETALSGADRRTTRRLMGTLVSSPFVGVDEHENEGCFFCFPDLSCRTHGKYRLRFVLVRLEPNDLQPGSFSPILTVAMSDVFTVFTAKDFPGMRASTPLTKALKRQGCAISVKKGNEKANAAAADEESAEEDADPSTLAQSPASAPGGGRKKRRKGQ
ncbi:MAG: hypothetical protein M1829_005724 [Trizodia sp. TS-e1964]|nr:MAG: hypothetical protein M1829_005724 [Trizodia sp. TS-e1964]